jgi:RNA polymerase sigma-70 factor (ECF subfamily)
MTTTNNFSSQQVLPVSPQTENLSASAAPDTALLVEMIKSKSERGFNILYDKYCGAMYSILIKFVRHTDVADDLLQETFVKIWKHIDRFDPSRGTLFTWMLNIARNHAIDYLRSSGHQQHTLNVSLDLCSNNLDHFGYTTSDTNRVEFKDFKSKALQLDPKYAEVIDLIFFYGWTYEQTAEILKLPLGTVKTRARKGLGMLKILYQQ